MAQKILTLSAGGIVTEVNDAYQGTVTSVASLTLGTTGTDLSSTVATGTTTPVITLQVPTASAANRGALSSSDWTAFNGKQAALGFTPVNKAGDTGVGNLSIGTLKATTASFIEGGDYDGSTVSLVGIGKNTVLFDAYLSIGTNQTNQYGYLQTQSAGAGFYKLLLSPNGGNVGVGGTTATYTLDVTGTARFTLAMINTPVAVASLPAGAAGMRAFANNALAPVWGAAVAGGGAVTVPVYYDGAAWRVG